MSPCVCQRRKVMFFNPTILDLLIASRTGR
jgi:hypothetical protein